VIEVFVDKKPTPCPTRKFENALIGVINADGTLRVSPPNRNTGVWQALQEDIDLILWKCHSAGCNMDKFCRTDGCYRNSGYNLPYPE
jgi:hypothetical protein